MDKFKYTVKLEVEIDAFDESDAWDAIQDAFGVGENGGINITQCDYSEKLQKRRK